MPTVAAFGRVVSGGTSTARSRVAWTRHPSRQPSESWPVVKVRASCRVTGTSTSEVIWILHLWQVPWPPHVESMAMPFHDAASKTVTPGGTRTLRCAGGTSAPPSALACTVKDRSTRPVPSCWAGSTPGLSIRPSRATSAIEKSGPSGGWVTTASRGGLRGLLGAVGGDPRHAPVVVAEEHVGRLDRLDDVGSAGVHDRARQPRGHRHGEPGAVEGVPARHPEGDVGGAAGHVDAEVVADASHHLEGH